MSYIIKVNDVLMLMFSDEFALKKMFFHIKKEEDFYGPLAGSRGCEGTRHLRPL